MTGSGLRPGMDFRRHRRVLGTDTSIASHRSHSRDRYRNRMVDMVAVTVGMITAEGTEEVAGTEAVEDTEDQDRRRSPPDRLTRHTARLHRPRRRLRRTVSSLLPVLVHNN